jgi:hypothetical protein
MHAAVTLIATLVFFDGCAEPISMPSVIVRQGCESGQGADTKIVQALAYYLDIPMSLVRVQATDSFINVCTAKCMMFVRILMLL